MVPMKDGKETREVKGELSPRRDSVCRSVGGSCASSPSALHPDPLGAALASLSFRLERGCFHRNGAGPALILSGTGLRLCDRASASGLF